MSESSFPLHPSERRQNGAMTDTEFAWVIERADSDPAEPKYWAAGQREPERSSAWTSNHMQAIRFARKLDAERVAERIMKETPVRVCEHGWDGQRDGAVNRAGTAALPKDAG